MYRYPALFIVILIFAYNSAVDIPADESENTRVLTDKGCFICKSVVEFLSVQIKFGNSTVQTLTKIADSICHKVAGPTGQFDCDTITGNISKIMFWLSEKMSPSQICMNLGLCH